MPSLRKMGSNFSQDRNGSDACGNVEQAHQEPTVVLVGNASAVQFGPKNLLLGQDEPVSGSVDISQIVAVSRIVAGRSVSVINLLGLRESDLPRPTVDRFISDLVSKNEIQAFIFVLCQLTDDDKVGLEWLLRKFGEDALSRTMMLFTYKSQEKCDTIVDDLMKNPVLDQLMKKCGGRYHTCSNSMNNQSELRTLLEKIDIMVSENGASSYSAEMYKTALKSRDVLHSQDRVSELGIILMGKSLSENSKVENFILGISAFETEIPPHSVNQQSEAKVESWRKIRRVGGKVNKRNIAVISTPDLFDQALSEQQLNQHIKECVSLADPGPHVTILVVQPDDFITADRTRVDNIFSCLPKEAYKYTLVLTTKDIEAGSSVDWAENVQNIITKCENRHLEFSRCQHADFIRMIEEIVKVNNERLICDACTDPESLVHHKVTGQEVELQEHAQFTAFEEDVQTELQEPENLEDTMICTHCDKVPEHVPPLPVLNLVLCGSDARLKASISDFILNEKGQRLGPRSECLMRKGVVSGYQVTLVETPTLYNTQLSEEEVMRETLQCVSLCNPGVHAFIIIIPVGPLQGDDKAEIKMIQRIFSSRMNDHTIVLFSNSNTDETAAINFIKQSSETEELLSMCSGRYIMLQKTESERLQQVPALLDQVKKMETTNKFYSLLMYVKAQRDEAKQELENKLSVKEERIKQLEKHQQQTCADGESPDSGSLRIVLIGKTGTGKSSTGNTILGKNEFQSKASMTSVTNICQKGVGEVQGKSIAVVDTLGLFDTTLSNEEVTEEIVKCISLSAPGPHAFIIVLSVGRITKEELETLSLIKKMFGTEAAKFTIVLFTHGDNLEDQTSIKEYIKNSSHKSMDKLIRDCGGRVHVFNNKEKNDRTQVHDLIRMIEEMIKSDRNNYFTNEMFEAAENSIQQKQKEILKEKEEQMQAEKEALKNKYEEELEKIRKSMETEKEKLEQERCEREKVFKEREEALRREFEKKEEEEKEKRRLEDLKKSEEDEQQKAENDRMLEEMRKEMENQNATFLKQQSEKDEEDRRRAEREKIKRERFEHEQKEAMEQLQIRQQEEIKKRDEEEQKRRKEQEDEQENWRRKMKEAENDKKEIKDDIERKLREREIEWKEKMRAREEEHKRTKEKHDKEVKEQEEKQEQIRRNFEDEREDERRKREEEREKLKEAERREREQREREYEGYIIKIKEEYEEQERIRKEEWEKRTSEDNERREEERKRQEEIVKERQEEIRRREKEDEDKKEKEERERKEMKNTFDGELEGMKNKYESEARDQAEQVTELTLKLKVLFHKLFLKEFEGHLLQELLQNAIDKINELTENKEESEGWSCVIQ